MSIVGRLTNAVERVGFPVVVAAVFCIVIVRVVMASEARMEAKTDDHIATTLSAIARRDANDLSVIGYLRELTRIARINCVHQSRSQSEISACLGIER